jgi:hypothetical protein
MPGQAKAVHRRQSFCAQNAEREQKPRANVPCGLSRLARAVRRPPIAFRAAGRILLIPFGSLFKIPILWRGQLRCPKKEARSTSDGQRPAG